MTKKFTRKLIEVEIRLGFLNIPSQGIDLMPNEKCKVTVNIDGAKNELSYNPTYRRIFGLTKFYKKYDIKTKDEVVLKYISEKEYDLILKSTKTDKQEITEKEAEELIDISNLSSQAKGDIVEDRIKEFLLLYGQGLLSVYRPVSDTEGIDMIVVKNGEYHPLFLQIKGRFGLHQGKTLILSIKVKTFTEHPNFYVVGAFFNPKTLEVDNKILMIPSKDLINEATIVNSKNGQWYRVTASMNDNPNNKWFKYIIDKRDLADKLLEKFEEMSQYFK